MLSYSRSSHARRKEKSLGAAARPKVEAKREPAGCAADRVEVPNKCTVAMRLLGVMKRSEPYRGKSTRSEPSRR